MTYRALRRVRNRSISASGRVQGQLSHPLRLRRPFFSPEREFRRATTRCEQLLSGDVVAFDGWESHQPVLLSLLRRLDSPRVLELGMGYGSTPVVLGLSKESVSLETARSWYRRFARFADDRHQIRHWSPAEEGWNIPWFSEEWDVVLIDHAPGETRQGSLEKLRDQSRFLVCHDTEECFEPSLSNYQWDFSAFPHVWTFDRFPTYTTVVSMREPIPLDSLGGISGPPPGG